MGRYRSGQPGQTVNLLAYAFVGSNPTRPTIIMPLIRADKPGVDLLKIIIIEILVFVVIVLALSAF